MRPESAFPFSPARLVINIKSEIAPCALEPFLAVGWVKNLLVVAWVLLPSADCRAHLREPKFPKFAWPSGDLLCPLCSLVLGIPTCPRARCRDCKHPQQRRAGTWPLLVLPKAVTSFFGCPGKSAGCWGALVMRRGHPCSGKCALRGSPCGSGVFPRQGASAPWGALTICTIF